MDGVLRRQKDMCGSTVYVAHFSVLALHGIKATLKNMLYDAGNPERYGSRMTRATASARHIRRDEDRDNYYCYDEDNYNPMRDHLFVRAYIKN